MATVGEFKTCMTELNMKYTTLREDVDKLCESLDGVTDKHDMLTSTVECNSLQVQEFQTEKHILNNELSTARKRLATIEQNIPHKLISNGTDSRPATSMALLAAAHAPIVKTTTVKLDKPENLNQNGHNCVLTPIESSVITSIESRDFRKSEDSGNDGSWQKAHYRRKFKRQGVIIGKAQQQRHQLQAVERTRKIHACFFKPDTTAEAMNLHMKEICKRTGFTVDKLKLKHDYYASFVLTVPESTFNVLLTPESWPAGTEVCEWFHRGARRGHYSRTRTPGQNDYSYEREDAKISEHHKKQF